MSAGWGVVNVGIAAGGLLASGAPPTEPGALVAAERQFHDILLFNLGLNVAYSAVGATMLGASYYGVDNVDQWRGFGASLILQGVGLLVLDGIAFWASRGRLSSLLDAGVHLSVHVAPTSAALTLQF
jgi:sulfite exporter TauE/SafE